MSDTIDNIDFSILQCVNDSERPLWKKKIYEYMEEYREYLPLQRDISAQTVGRRVDELADEGYLASVITSSEDVNRHMIIGYTDTEKGVKVLEDKRETLLKDIVFRELFSDDSFPIEKEALITLIEDEFRDGICDSDKLRDYSRKQLLIMTGALLLEQDAADEFPAQKRACFYGKLQEKNQKSN